MAFDVISWNKIDEVKELVKNIPTAITNLANDFSMWKAPWTSSRAAKIDNLDTTVSSVKSAVQNIDLSNVAKESTLDNVNTAINGLPSADGSDEIGRLTTIEVSTNSTKKTLVDVRGKGALLFCATSTSVYGADITIEIDGKTYSLPRCYGYISKKNSVIVRCSQTDELQVLSVPSVNGNSIQNAGGTFRIRFSNMLPFCTNLSPSFNLNDDRAHWLYFTENPLRFDEHLKITASTPNSYSVHTQYLLF